MVNFQTCPSLLPIEMSSLVQQFANAWARSPVRPCPHRDQLDRWDELVKAWANDALLPLFVRKHDRNRGCVINHSSGRELVPVDNSPASWAFMLACVNRCPSLDDVRRMLVDEIPVAMIFKSDEKIRAKYRGTLANQNNVNTAGWKLAHIRRVGLHTREPLAGIPLEALQAHFQDFLAPSNMFVVPNSGPESVRRQRWYKR